MQRQKMLLISQRKNLTKMEENIATSDIRAINEKIERESAFIDFPLTNGK